MYKVNIFAVQISQAQLGTLTCSPQINIYRSNTTTLYEMPIWYKAIDIASNKLKLKRVQRIINIKIAKAYRTVSNEALCALTGLTPTTIKIQEAYQYFRIVRGQEKEDTNVETRMGTQYWQHPAETITFLAEETKDTSIVQIYTNGSKSEK